MPEFRLFGGSVRHALIHAVTQYDIRQSRGKYHNPYALAQYLARVEDTMADIDNGADARAAVCAGFTGPLLTACLRAIGEHAPTRDELTGAGQYTYRPVAS